MRVGAREFRKELTLSFAVNSLPVDHAPFDPANFSLTAPSGALLFWQERDGQQSARLLAPILASPRQRTAERADGGCFMSRPKPFAVGGCSEAVTQRHLGLCELQ